MARARIYDLDRGQKLAVDLRHLLDLLAPRSYQAGWKISAFKSSGHELFEATGRAGGQLQKLAECDSMLSGTALAALASGIQQIIWGEFTGLLSETNDIPWVTIRFVDSTFCEIDTMDETVLNKIGSSYRDVRDDDRPPR
jgi:hypothetical protein